METYSFENINKKHKNILFSCKTEYRKKSLSSENMRPRPEVTGTSCDRGYFSAAIKAVLTSFCVNECPVTTFNLNNGSYCSCRLLFFSSIAIPILA